jgi:hypothetical protein
MGFLRDVRKLSKVSKEASKGFDPAAQMRSATASMQQMTAQQRIASSGSSAPAKVIAVRDTGTMINYQPVVEVDVLVTPDGSVPWPATATSMGHARLAGLAPGASVTIRYDPADPSTVVLT